MGGWPIAAGLVLAAVATVVSSHAYLWMTAGLSVYAFGIGVANAGLVRLTLFASEMSKGTVSAAMGMLQMLIFTVGIEVSKHAYAFGGNGLFSLFNLANGVNETALRRSTPYQLHPARLRHYCAGLQSAPPP